MGRSPGRADRLGALQRLLGKNGLAGVTNVGVRTELSAKLEHNGIVAWRRNQLLTTGFPSPLAERLAADGRYDLHALIELVERGCPPELATRILAPLEEAA